MMKQIFLTFLILANATLASQARSLFMSDKRMELIRVGTGRSTVISFPVHPSKVILGSEGEFAIQFVENDIAISAVKLTAHSNLFVYMEGRRFGFELTSTPGGGDEIVIVRDSDDRKVKVKIQNG